MDRAVTTGDRLRAGLLSLGAVCQVAFAFIPALLGWENEIGAQSQRYETVLVPAGFAFVIWLPLYSGSLIFAVYHAFRLRDPLVVSVGWAALGAYWANAVWAVHVQSLQPDWISFALLEAILVFSVAGAWIARSHQPYSIWKSLFFAPVFALGGWLAVASPAGFSLALNIAVDGNWPFGLTEAEMAFAVLAVWALCVGVLSWRLAALAFLVPTLWGLYAVYAANAARGEDRLAWTALALGGLLTLLTLAGKFRQLHGRD